jgi:pimeloyl-ACP methyl ester carboxylesterase
VDLLYGVSHLDDSLNRRDGISMTRILFLPGAGGSPEIWKPVGSRLPDHWSKVYLGWPGLRREPHDPAIASLDDLVGLAATRIEAPVDLVAHSMGGVVAARVALARPALVRRLVLAVTSAGVDTVRLGAADWRADYRREFPTAAAWITEPRAVSPLPLERIAMPTLLIWGDADPISPVAIGQHLESRMPNAKLHVIAGGSHRLALDHPELVARLIGRHLK